MPSTFGKTKAAAHCQSKVTMWILWLIEQRRKIVGVFFLDCQNAFK